jgi:hypothetical protein
MLNKQRKFILREHLFEGRAYNVDTVLYWDRGLQSWVVSGRGNLTQGSYTYQQSEQQALLTVHGWQVAPIMRENRNTARIEAWRKAGSPRNQWGNATGLPLENKITFIVENA